ncbi:DUF2637 domain-containing protein [Nonomuraea insulae]|uniref:DUF2637 domain-containing protein n=1 Tax=Nonomuraea insulae TaxID=1616787 RepID=A0ABW1DCE9_9ACTN
MLWLRKLARRKCSRPLASRRRREWGHTSRERCRRIGGFGGRPRAAVLVLAAIAAVVSFRHMRKLALTHGEDALAAALIPLAVDGTIVAASMSLLRASRHGSRGGLLPWVLLIISSLASVGANVAVAEPNGDRSVDRGGGGRFRRER